MHVEQSLTSTLQSTRDYACQEFTDHPCPCPSCLCTQRENQTSTLQSSLEQSLTIHVCSPSQRWELLPSDSHDRLVTESFVQEENASPSINWQSKDQPDQTQSSFVDQRTAVKQSSILELQEHHIPRPSHTFVQTHVSKRHVVAETHVVSTSKANQEERKRRKAKQSVLFVCFFFLFLQKFVRTVLPNYTNPFITNMLICSLCLFVELRYFIVACCSFVRCLFEHFYPPTKKAQKKQFHNCTFLDFFFRRHCWNRSKND